MTPFVSHSLRVAYFNYRDLDLWKNGKYDSNFSKAKIWGNKYFKGISEKLVQVKTRIDHENYFRNEQCIPIIKYA
jgi:hypothetical protein